MKDTTAAAGHLVHRVNLSDLAFPDITSREEWEHGLPLAGHPEPAGPSRVGGTSGDRLPALAWGEAGRDDPILGYVPPYQARTLRTFRPSA